jgi:hypothetical protein
MHPVEAVIVGDRLQVGPERAIVGADLAVGRLH